MARHGAAAARPEAGQVGRAGAAADGASSDNLLARFHALWTLEGLGALDPALVREAHEGQEPAHARAGDSRQRDALQGGRQVVRRRLPRADQGRRPNVVIQAMLTANLFKLPDAADVDQGGAVREQGQGCGARRRASRWRRRRRLAAAGVVRSRPTKRSGCSRAATCSARCASPATGRDGLGKALEGAAPGAGRSDDGAGAGGLAARAGASRLHDQGAAARADRSARRQDVSRRHGADWQHQQRRVDRGRRVVRPQQLRQQRRHGDAGRRRARAHRRRRTGRRRGRSPSSRPRCRARSTRSSGS